MTSIKQQSGFSLTEVLIASSLFAFTFVSSLQLYLFIYGQWEQHEYYQQTHQQLYNDIIDKKISMENNLDAFYALPDLPASAVPANAVAASAVAANAVATNNQLIKYPTLHKEIPQSAKLLTTSAKVTSMQSTLIISVPYETSWQDLQTIMPFTPDESESGN